MIRIQRRADGRLDALEGRTVAAELRHRRMALVVIRPISRCPTTCLAPAEVCHCVAERIRDPLRRLLSHPAAAEFIGMDRIAEDDGDGGRTRQDPTHGQRALRALNEHRNGRNVEALQQLADAGEEALELTRPRAAALREPDEILLALQDGRAQR